MHTVTRVYSMGKETSVRNVQYLTGASSSSVYIARYSRKLSETRIRRPHGISILRNSYVRCDAHNKAVSQSQLLYAFDADHFQESCVALSYIAPGQ